MSVFITAEHPQCGRLWAAVDEQAHHLTGQVAERRFAAFLTPYNSREEAEAALIAEGGAVEVRS
jgi:hypothetical protein